MRDRIRSILASISPQGNLDAVADADSLLNAGVIDSLAMMDLVQQLETDFGIRVSEEELVPENFESVEAIAAFLAGKGAGS